MTSRVCARMAEDVARGEVPRLRRRRGRAASRAWRRRFRPAPRRRRPRSRTAPRTLSASARADLAQARSSRCMASLRPRCATISVSVSLGKRTPLLHRGARRSWTWFSMMPLCTTAMRPAHVRVRVRLARAAVGGPARVAHAGGAAERVLLQRRCRGWPACRRRARSRRPPGVGPARTRRVVAAILEATKTLDEDGHGPSFRRSRRSRTWRKSLP